MSTVFDQPYVDGWFGAEVLLSLVPRVKTLFKTNPVRQDTYSREYEWDYEVRPRSFTPKLANRTAWTNLLTYSETFTNAAWTKTNLTAAANVATAADGNTTLGRVLETVTNAEHSLTQAATVTATAFEASIFIKGGLTRTRVRLAFIDSAATTFSAYFNTDGTWDTPSAGVTAKVVWLGNRDMQCIIRFTPAAGAGTFKFNVVTTTTTISYAGTTTNGVYVWGAQLNAGTDAPYISTTSAARSVLAPDRDPLDPFAFMVFEEDPTVETSETAKITRRFARIPLTQTMPGSRTIPKPRIAGDFPRVINGVLVDYSGDSDAESPEYTFYSQIPVTSDSGPPTFAITGGDFDFTVGGDAASNVAYNASAGTIQTAFNALGSVSDRNGVVVTGGPSQFIAQFNPWPTATADTSGLTSGLGISTTISYQSPSGVLRPFRDYVRFRITGSFTGGDFTITLLGEETAPIAFDASTADVLAAVNALTVIGSGASVSIPTGVSGGAYSGKPLQLTNGVIDFTVGIPFPDASADGSGLTPSGTATLTPNRGVVDGVEYFGYVLSLSGGAATTRTITAASHGLTASDDLAVSRGGDIIFISAGQFTVPSANTIQLTSASGSAFWGPAITAIGTANGNTYAADSPEIPIELVTRFYLPGVSADITTATDIPIPARGTPAQLLGAIFGGATLFTYQVGEKGQYEETPFFSLTVTQFNPQHLVSPATS